MSLSTSQRIKLSECGSFLLVRYPEVLNKLREEVYSTLNGSTDISRSDLRRMVYLQNVLKESKQILPSVELYLLMSNVHWL